MTEETVGPGGVDTEDAEDRFVIDELSRRTGLTVRSIRSYQTRKLLPPPIVEGRTGYYTPAHVTRVELIKDLQSQGLKLSSIARMLDDQLGTDEDLLRFTRTVSSLFGERSGTMTTAEELQQRFHVADEDAGLLLGKALELNLVQDLGDGTFEELAPQLLAAGERAVAVLDLDARTVTRVLEQLHRHATAVASLYLELYVERVWAPFVAEGRPHDEWEAVESALNELGPIATQALVGTFDVVMAAKVAEVVETEVARPAASSRKRRTGRRR